MGRMLVALTLLLATSAQQLSAQDLETPEKAAEAEAALLPGLSGKAAREGQTLRLVLADDKALTLTNKTKCTGYEDCVFYYLQAHLPELGYYLLEVFRYEGRFYLLVDERSGGKEVVYGQPKFSPDGKAFVATCSGEIDCSAIEVHRFTERGLWREFAFTPEYYAVYHVVRWKGNDKVILDRVTYEEIDDVQKEIHDDAQLILEKGHWRLEEP